jgi:ribokinase
LGKRAALTVVGTAHMDFIAYLDRFPEPGETIMGKGFVSAPGGKGANQAIAAHRLGADCYLVSKVGDDFVGESLLENARKNGLKIDCMKKDARSYSGVAVIYVNQKGENMIAVAPGVDRLISEEDVRSSQQAISSTSTVLTQLEIPSKTDQFAMEQAKRMGKKTLLNPAPASELNEDIYGHIDYITPNRGELTRLTGMRAGDDKSILEAANSLIERGVGHVIVTLGKRGAMVVTPSEHGLVPSYDVNAVDTVGAGDAFNGALAVGISLECEIYSTIKFANLVAALKTTRRGAQEGLPTLKEAMNFAHSLGIDAIPKDLIEGFRN